MIVNNQTGVNNESPQSHGQGNFPLPKNVSNPFRNSSGLYGEQNYHPKATPKEESRS